LCTRLCCVKGYVDIWVFNFFFYQVLPLNAVFANLPMVNRFVRLSITTINAANCIYIDAVKESSFMEYNCFMCLRKRRCHVTQHILQSFHTEQSYTTCMGYGGTILIPRSPHGGSFLRSWPGEEIPHLLWNPKVHYHVYMTSKTWPNPEPIEFSPYSHTVLDKKN